MPTKSTVLKALLFVLGLIASVPAAAQTTVPEATLLQALDEAWENKSLVPVEDPLVIFVSESSEGTNPDSLYVRELSVDPGPASPKRLFRVYPTLGVPKTDAADTTYFSLPAGGEAESLYVRSEKGIAPEGRFSFFLFVPKGEVDPEVWRGNDRRDHRAQAIYAGSEQASGDGVWPLSCYRIKFGMDRSDGSGMSSVESSLGGDCSTGVTADAQWVRFVHEGKSHFVLVVGSHDEMTKGTDREPGAEIADDFWGEFLFVVMKNNAACPPWYEIEAMKKPYFVLSAKEFAQLQPDEYPELEEYVNECFSTPDDVLILENAKKSTKVRRSQFFRLLVRELEDDSLRKLTSLQSVAQLLVSKTDGPPIRFSWDTQGDWWSDVSVDPTEFSGGLKILVLNRDWAGPPDTQTLAPDGAGLEVPGVDVQQLTRYGAVALGRYSEPEAVFVDVDGVSEQLARLQGSAVFGPQSGFWSAEINPRDYSAERDFLFFRFASSRNEVTLTTQLVDISKECAPVSVVLSADPFDVMPAQLTCEDRRARVTLSSPAGFSIHSASSGELSDGACETGVSSEVAGLHNMRLYCLELGRFSGSENVALDIRADDNRFQGGYANLGVDEAMAYEQPFAEIDPVLTLAPATALVTISGTTLPEGFDLESVRFNVLTPDTPVAEIRATEVTEDRRGVIVEISFREASYKVWQAWSADHTGLEMIVQDENLGFLGPQAGEILGVAQESFPNFEFLESAQPVLFEVSMARREIDLSGAYSVALKWPGNYSNYYCRVGLRIDGQQTIWLEAPYLDRPEEWIAPSSAGDRMVVGPGDTIELVTGRMPNDAIADRTKSCRADGTVFATVTAAELESTRSIEVPYQKPVIAYIMRSRATDGTYGTRHMDTYLDWLQSLDQLLPARIVLIRQPKGGREFAEIHSPDPLAAMPNWIDYEGRLRLAEVTEGVPNLRDVVEDALETGQRYGLADGEYPDIIVFRQAPTSVLGCRAVVNEMRALLGAGVSLVLLDDLRNGSPVETLGDGTTRYWSEESCNGKDLFPDRGDEADFTITQVATGILNQPANVRLDYRNVMKGAFAGLNTE